MMIATLFGSLLLAVTPNAAALVTNGAANGLPWWGQPIRDDSTGVAVIGWGATDGVTGETLDQVDVDFINRFNFNAIWDLESMNTNGAVSGVAIYKDTSNAGANNDVLDGADTALVLSGWNWNGWNTIQMNVNADPVPNNANGIYEWFIVIRTDDNMPGDCMFQVRMNQWDIDYSGGNWGPTNAVTTNRLVVDRSRSVDMIGGGGTWVGNWSAPVNETASMGIHVVDGGAGDTLDYLWVDFMNSGGITNSDFQPLVTNGSLSGLALYRDDGTIDDEWDRSDTYMTLSGIGGSFNSQIWMDINAEPVPNTGNGQFDFFFVVRPSATVQSWEWIHLTMWNNDIRIDGIVDTDTYTPESNWQWANNDGPIRFDATLPTIQWAWWANSVPYLWVNATNTLFFSSLMPGVESGAPTGQAWDGESDLDRMDFSNEPGLWSSPGSDNSPDNWQGIYGIAASSDDDDSPVTVTLYDNVGWNVSQNLTYEEDNELPYINITYPTAGLHVAGDVGIKVSSYDAKTALQTIEISFDYGASWNNMIWDGSDFTYVWNTAATPDGAGRVSVRATDMVMNVAIGSQNIVLDNTGPVVTPTDPVSGGYVMTGVSTNVLSIAQDSSNIDKVQVSVDGGQWNTANFDYQVGAWSYPWTPITEGMHILEFRGFDELGNMGGTSSLFVYADGTAPTVDVISPDNGDYIRGGVTIQIEADDTMAMSGTALSLDMGASYLGPVFNGGTGYYEYYWDTTRYNDGSYEIHALAGDIAGNMATDEDTMVVVDNTAPLMSIIAPVYEEFVGGDYLIEASVMDATSGVDYVEYRVDGGTWKTMDLDAGDATVTWDTTTVNDGGHTIEITVYDRSGNSATRSTVVIVDNGIPTCVMVEPKDDQYVAGSFVFTVNANDNIAIDYLELNFSGDSTISQLGTVMASYGIADGLFSYSVDTTLYNDGPATVTPTVYDLVGNSYEGTTVNFNVDNWPSAVSIITPEEDALVQGEITLDIELTERFISSVDYQMDNGGWFKLSGPSWSAPIDTAALDDGDHTITVRAIDNSSRVTTESVDITVDNTPPEVVIVTPLDGQVLEGIQTFRVAASDIVGVKTLDITIGENPASAMIFNAEIGQYEYIMNTADLVDGTYEVKATAKDAIGHSTSKTIDVDVLNNPEVLAPTGVFVTPLEGELVSGEIQVQVSAEDDLGVDRVKLAHPSGSSMRMVVDKSSGYYSTFLDTTSLTDGPVTLDVTISNIAGKSTTISRNITVDNSAPEVTLKKTQLDDGSHEIKATVTDSSDIVEVQYRVDGGEWKNMADKNGQYVGYWHSDVKDNGKHIVEVRAVDDQGNEGTSNTAVTVEIFDSATAGMISLAALLLLLAAVALILAFLTWRKKPKTSGSDMGRMDDEMDEPVSRPRPTRRSEPFIPEPEPEPEDEGASLSSKEDESELKAGDIENR